MLFYLLWCFIVILISTTIAFMFPILAGYPYSAIIICAKWGIPFGILSILLFPFFLVLGAIAVTRTLLLKLFPLVIKLALSGRLHPCYSCEISWVEQMEG
jgi:hypothetical protein